MAIAMRRCFPRSRSRRGARPRAPGSRWLAPLDHGTPPPPSDLDELPFPSRESEGHPARGPIVAPSRRAQRRFAGSFRRSNSRRRSRRPAPAGGPRPAALHPRNRAAPDHPQQPGKKLRRSRKCREGPAVARPGRCSCLFVVLGDRRRLALLLFHSAREPAPARPAAHPRGLARMGSARDRTR